MTGKNRNSTLVPDVFEKNNESLKRDVGSKIPLFENRWAARPS
jgi:hypothetical protein